MAAELSTHIQLEPRATSQSDPIVPPAFRRRRHFFDPPEIVAQMLDRLFQQLPSRY